MEKSWWTSNKFPGWVAVPLPDDLFPGETVVLFPYNEYARMYVSEGHAKLVVNDPDVDERYRESALFYLAYCDADHMKDTTNNTVNVLD